VLCGEFHFGPDCHWLFAEEQALIHLQTAERKSFPELETLLTMLVRESQNSLPGSMAMVKGLANTLLAMMLRILLSLREPPPGMLRLMSDKRLSPALLAVFADPAYPWTLELMAERCFLSRATFARYFAHSYHQTPQSWLTHLRMALASRLLIDERVLAVDIIAERCGFLSLSSFTKAFKKRYGITPAVYRKASPKTSGRAGRRAPYCLMLPARTEGLRRNTIAANKNLPHMTPVAKTGFTGNGIQGEAALFNHQSCRFQP
jgi:AraC family transcriptional activator of mtrCDE